MGGRRRGGKKTGSSPGAQPREGAPTSALLAAGFVSKQPFTMICWADCWRCVGFGNKMFM
eukprot:3489511-Amphidinium_carterae.1